MKFLNVNEFYHEMISSPNVHTNLDIIKDNFPITIQVISNNDIVSLKFIKIDNHISFSCCPTYLSLSHEYTHIIRALNGKFYSAAIPIPIWLQTIYTNLEEYVTINIEFFNENSIRECFLLRNNRISHIAINYDTGWNFALSKLNSGQIKILKNLLGGRIEKIQNIQEIDMENENYKNISFTKEEFLYIKNELKNINLKEVKHICEKFEKIDKNILNLIKFYIVINVVFGFCPSRISIEDLISCGLVTEKLALNGLKKYSVSEVYDNIDLLNSLYVEIVNHNLNIKKLQIEENTYNINNSVTQEPLIILSDEILQSNVKNESGKDIKFFADPKNKIFLSFKPENELVSENINFQKNDNSKDENKDEKNNKFSISNNNSGSNDKV